MRSLTTALLLSALAIGLSGCTEKQPATAPAPANTYRNPHQDADGDDSSDRHIDPNRNGDGRIKADANSTS